MPTNPNKMSLKYYKKKEKNITTKVTKGHYRFDHNSLFTI